jgi:AraC-like DNA-binding protein
MTDDSAVPAGTPTALGRRPTGPLANFVSWVWLQPAGAPARGPELRLPTGDVDLVVDVGREQVLVCGPTARPAVLDGESSGELMGAVLRVGAAAAVLRTSLADLRDQCVALGELRPAAARLLARPPAGVDASARLDVLELVLTERLVGSAVSSHPVAAHAAAQIRQRPGDGRVDRLGEAFGLSARRMEQIFRVQVGLPPKSYQRLHRFRGTLAAVDRAGAVGWAALAAERGYADQSHLVRDFVAHAGLPPTHYLAIRGPDAYHVALTG